MHSAVQPKFLTLTHIRRIQDAAYHSFTLLASHSVKALISCSLTDSSALSLLGSPTGSFGYIVPSQMRSLIACFGLVTPFFSSFIWFATAMHISFGLHFLISPPVSIPDAAVLSRCIIIVAYALVSFCPPRTSCYPAMLFPVYRATSPSCILPPSGPFSLT